ncbi:MAG TPA: hypothetical protein VFJ76_07945 [Solirubrobacterales bacterium]|nr:hypothetical protein [Solirubrobacterales bacterium]
MPVEDHQRLLRAEEEKREAAQATIARMDAANVRALEEAGAWDDPSGTNGVVSNIKRLGARAKAAESQLEEVAQELEEEAEKKVGARDASRTNHSPAGRQKTGRLDGEAYGLRAAAQLLRDKGTEQLQENSKSVQTLEMGTEQEGEAMRAEIWVLPNVCAEQPAFANGVRLVDPVDRVLAGDDLVETAEDFNLRPEEVDLALRVFAAAGGRVSKSYHHLRRSTQQPEVAVEAKLYTDRIQGDEGVAVEGDPGLERIERLERFDPELDDDRTGVEMLPWPEGDWLRREDVIRELQGERGEG